MTRINVGIEPKYLTNKHLLAEHREITRIPRAIKVGKFSFRNMPEKFTLGNGHVKFFYNKIKYLHSRYIALYNECIERGFNVSNYSSAFDGIPAEFYNDYNPSHADMIIIIDRILEKLSTQKHSDSEKFVHFATNFMYIYSIQATTL